MAPRGTPGMAVGLSGSGIIDGVAQLIVNEWSEAAADARVRVRAILSELALAKTRGERTESTSTA